MNQPTIYCKKRSNLGYVTVVSRIIIVAKQNNCTQINTTDARYDVFPQWRWTWMFLVVNHTVFSDRRSTNSKKTDVETSKPSLTQFHKFSSIEIPLLPSINTCINFNVYVVISEAFIMYSLQVQVETVQSSVLIYWQQSCTHIFFRQWINSKWNKEFQLIVVRQHTPLHQVTIYEQWLGILQPVVTWLLLV